MCYNSGLLKLIFIGFANVCIGFDKQLNAETWNTRTLFSRYKKLDCSDNPTGCKPTNSLAILSVTIFGGQTESEHISSLANVEICLKPV